MRIVPKTRRYLARQHRKSTDLTTARFLCWLIGNARSDVPLWPGSSSSFRTRWRHIMSFLQLPYREIDAGLTPGCLRGSGATFFFNHTEDLQRTAWRGGWARQRTMEAYLQEASSHAVLRQAAPAARERIRELAALAPPAMASLFNSTKAAAPSSG